MPLYFLALFFVPTLSLAIAILYFERYLGLLPCPLCMAQRLFIALIAINALIALCVGLKYRISPWFARSSILLALLGAIVSARHIWMQYIGTNIACGPDIYSLLEVASLNQIISSSLLGTGDCAKIVWQLFGISIPGWTFLFFLALAYTAKHALKNLK